jgi:hypothetical protein
MTDHAYLPARKLLCRSDEYALAVNHDKVTTMHLFSEWVSYWMLKDCQSLEHCFHEKSE